MTAEASALTDDAITADFRIWQRRRGHRYSLDDVATAWVAVQARPAARRVLYYVDPMHPAYTSDRPGTAPDCGT